MRGLFIRRLPPLGIGRDSAPVLATIDYLGSFSIGTGTGSPGAGVLSNAVPVPVDARLVIVHISAFNGLPHYFSGGSMSFTKGGVATPMVSYGGGAADSNVSAWQSAGFYLPVPDTGPNQTLEYDWLGAGGADVSNFALTFWKGVDTASPVRDSAATVNSAAIPTNTSLLAAEPGDRIVAHYGGFVGAEDGSGAVTAWNNLTSLAEPPKAGFAELSLATGSPSGNTTVGVQSVAGYSQGGLVALVLKPGIAG